MYEALFAYVTEWDDAHAPQIYLEIVAGSRPTEEINASELHKLIVVGDHRGVACPEGVGWPAMTSTRSSALAAAWARRRYVHSVYTVELSRRGLRWRLTWTAAA